MSEYSRVIDIKIEIDRWSGGSLQESKDVTRDIENYRFQKSIKAPQGSCQLSILPQSATTHIMDIIKPMDVVRIREFGVVKFLGYITRVSYDGMINPDGKPARHATITCQQFGGLLVSAAIGLGLGTALGKEDDPFVAGATELLVAIRNLVDEDGTTFAELVGALYTNFRDYLSAIGATNFLTYLDTYFDAESGLTSAETPAIPRTVELYTGTEQSLTFWQLAEQLVQRPFNELWIDNGTRQVSIDGQNVDLPEKACLVFRPAPFNGTVTATGSVDRWDELPIIEVSNDHLIRFDLARSMEEVYTFYSVKEPAYDFADNLRLLYGIPSVDEDRVGTYLFRPFVSELFYTRVLDTKGEIQQFTKGQAETVAQRAADTLLNWFQHNDEFLSGVIQMMVPSDPSLDPRIGDKVRVYGIDGEFYVEGIAHTWSYLGALKSDLTVTRGYNKQRSIELKDRIFRRNVIQ